MASELRGPRRRRSVALTPALLDPAQVPDDAAGRIEVIAVRAPDDIAGEVDADAPILEPPAGSPATLQLLALGDGWVAVGAIAAILFAVFIVGIVLTR